MGFLEHMHFFRFNVTLAWYNNARNGWRWSMFLFGICRNMMMSSQHTSAMCHLNYLRNMSIALWTVFVAFSKPKGHAGESKMTMSRCKGHLIAMLLWTSTCQYLLVMSHIENVIVSPNKYIYLSFSTFKYESGIFPALWFAIIDTEARSSVFLWK